MAKPPPDADPDKFIIGRGSYGNLQTAKAVFENGVFRLDPAPMPVVSIVIVNLVFAAFFFGFHWVAKHFSSGQTDLIMLYIAPVGVGVMTCVGYTAIAWYSFAKANRLGSWMVYDTRTGEIELPREHERFTKNEIVYLQYITTKDLAWGGTTNNERLSELNLVTCRDGVRKRWPLLRSIANVRAFDRLLKPLVEHTDLPIVRVQDEWLGWKVTERPYRDSPETTETSLHIND